jgi:hypothetical protein
MPALKNALLALAVLGSAACATKAGDAPQVVTEGKAVYVLNVATEQDARASAVSICRARGGNAVFNGMVQYHRHEDNPPYHTVLRAAGFDCTN